MTTPSSKRLFYVTFGSFYFFIKGICDRIFCFERVVSPFGESFPPKMTNYHHIWKLNVFVLPLDTNTNVNSQGHITLNKNDVNLFKIFSLKLIWFYEFIGVIDMQFIYLFSKVKIEYYVFKLIGMEMIS
jgi:hypothetical protein